MHSSRGLCEIQLSPTTKTLVHENTLEGLNRKAYISMDSIPSSSTFKHFEHRVWDEFHGQTDIQLSRIIHQTDVRHGTTRILHHIPYTRPRNTRIPFGHTTCASPRHRVKVWIHCRGRFSTRFAHTPVMRRCSPRESTSRCHYVRLCANFNDTSGGRSMFGRVRFTLCLG